MSLKGANSPTRGRKLRSTGTKTRAHVGQVRKPPADLEQQLEACRRELAEAREQLSEALEQQTATSEVLQVISSSPGELQLVFAAMLANAMRVCEAKFGFMQRYEGDTWKIAAAQGAPAYTEYLQQHYEHKQPGPETVSARIVITRLC